MHRDRQQRKERLDNGDTWPVSTRPDSINTQTHTERHTGRLGEGPEVEQHAQRENRRGRERESIIGRRWSYGGLVSCYTQDQHVCVCVCVCVRLCDVCRL